MCHTFNTWCRFPTMISQPERSPKPVAADRLSACRTALFQLSIPMTPIILLLVMWILWMCRDICLIQRLACMYSSPSTCLLSLFSQFVVLLAWVRPTLVSRRGEISVCVYVCMYRSIVRSGISFNSQLLSMERTLQSKSSTTTIAA